MENNRIGATPSQCMFPNILNDYDKFCENSLETDEIEVIAVIPKSNVNGVPLSPYHGNIKPSIYINPKMKPKIHINRKLMNIKIQEIQQIPQITERKNSIFVNPKLIETWSSKLNKIDNPSPVNTKVTPNSKLVALSKRKLVRVKRSPKSVNSSVVPVMKVGQSRVVEGKLKLDNRIQNLYPSKNQEVKGKLKIDNRVRNVSFVSKGAKISNVKGKLKLDNRIKGANVARSEMRKGKLKIDNRAKNSNSLAKVEKSQVVREKFKLDNRAKNARTIVKKKEFVAVKDQLKLDNRVRKKVSPNKNRRKSNFVSISGVMYKSSENRLVKSTYDCTPSKRMRSSLDQFKVTKDGKKMCRLDSMRKRWSLDKKPKDVPKHLKNRKSNLKKFISDKMKQKSLQILRNKLRINNQPCLMFQKFGFCVKNAEGTCPKVHDTNQISLCRKFLQGMCFGECKLSHNVGPEKMPTCKYFLKGCCNREACSYLHVKVSNSTPICLEFLRGYCKKGSECKQRHVFVCPEFDKTKKCSKGKYCTYPHISQDSKFAPKIATQQTLAPSTSHRYYQAKEGQDQSGVEKEISQNVDTVNQITSPVKSLEKDECSRPALGPLPAFIPITD